MKLLIVDLQHLHLGLVLTLSTQLTTCDIRCNHNKHCAEKHTGGLNFCTEGQYKVLSLPAAWNIPATILRTSRGQTSSCHAGAVQGTIGRSAHVCGIAAGPVLLGPAAHKPALHSWSSGFNCWS